MARFLHTADWQLGLKLHFVPGDRGARLRLQRFETIRRIAELAAEQEVEAVVVAGDVFDDNGVGPDTLQATRDALRAFAPVPVLLLPGNHDAATADCALGRLLPPGEDPAASGLGHVVPLLDTEPVEVAGTVYHPCPLERRHSVGDPTAHLPVREEGEERVRVAVAHGAVLDFGESCESPNRIDAERVLRLGFDYLALGDWHGTFHLGDRVWYSGTHEPTRFAEKDPGGVLLVEIADAGSRPQVERLPVARGRWLSEKRTLESHQELASLAAWLGGLPERSFTLLRLELEGALSLAERAELEEMLARQEGELLYLRVVDDALGTAPSEADLEGLEVAGFVGDALEELRADPSRAAADALGLLYRWRREAAG